MNTTQPIRATEDLSDFKHYYKEIHPCKRNYALIILGLNTALRISDILSLKNENVFDFQNRKWKTHIEITEHKTGKMNCIYLNKEVIATLKEYVAEEACFSKQHFLFCSKKFKERPLSRCQAYRIIKHAAEYVGLSSHISCHSLRKTFGYHAWKQGIPPALLMSIYNHSSYQITKRYLCIEQDDKDAVFENIKL